MRQSLRWAHVLDLLNDVRPVLVLEAVEHAGLHEATPRFISIADRVELEEDEDVVRVFDVRKTRCTFAFSRASGRSRSNIGLQVS